MPLNPLNQPFRIGIRPLSPDNWLVVDERLASYRAQKIVLVDTALPTVYATTEGMQESEKEVMEAVRLWLQNHAPDALTDYVETQTRSSLVQACLMINEDIAIMRRFSEGWKLSSGCICFPSLWNIADKVGRVLADVHSPVPGFGHATRQAHVIEQMFDNLRVNEPVVRFNYSVHDQARLHLPDSRESRKLPLENVVSDSHYIRSERQTLTRMPGSGDVVFTIDTSHRQIGDLTDEERQMIESHLPRLSDEELHYKGFVKEK